MKFLLFSNEQRMNFILFAFAFCLPLFPKLLPPLIILLFFFWLVAGNLKERLLLFFKNKTAVFFSAFFFLHLIGLFYSNNLKYGFVDIETKLSLLIFPFLFSTIREKIDKDRILRIFILGCFTASAACFLKAAYLFFSSAANNFFYTDFSLFLHPSYFAVYLNLAILILLIWNFNLDSFYKKIINYSLIVFFSITIIFLSSKMGIISLIIPFIVSYCCLFFVKKKYLKTIIHFFVFFIVILISYKYIITETRFATLHNIENFNFQQLNQAEADSLAKPDMVYKITESNQIRYLVWIEAIKLVRENWLAGVGTGDIKDELLKKYEKDNLWWILEKKYNAHNQFLQTWGALGIPGILFILGGFIIAFYQSIKKRKFIYFGFLLLLILNFLVESMLETQAGVIFFAFFNSLFCFIPSAKTDTGNLQQAQKSP